MHADVELELAYPQTELRPASKVMRLERMGSFFPTRISFMRIILRQLATDKSKVVRDIWSIDGEGYGHAVYSLKMGGFTYSLVAFANRLDPSQRTDRVIAEAWDTSFVLFDGVPDESDIERLRANAPLQEAGRFSPQDLILSRANKSIRLFDHVVEKLSKGEQPDAQMIDSIGYLMRTTAVYGNGKFGIADRDLLASRPGLRAPFQAEMLLVWLVRGFTHDLVEHVAQQKSPKTYASLDKKLKRHLGIGNSTGLGMAPFLVSHPVLINNWVMVRETALARVRILKIAEPEVQTKLLALMKRVAQHLQQWNVPDERQKQRVLKLREEWVDVQALANAEFLKREYCFEQLINASAQWSTECQELIIAMLLEPQSELVDGLSECLDCQGEPRLNPIMKVDELSKLLTDNFEWACVKNLKAESASKQFWYVSEEKLEPRLGNRFEEEGAELEQPFDIPLRCQALKRDLDVVSKHQSVAEFLIRYPQHRYIVRRVQLSKHFPYAEIRDNLVGEECLPIDMLRCKLSFFGAAKFDPKSDRWTRITMYQGAPLFDELDQENHDDWWMPVLEDVAE